MSTRMKKATGWVQRMKQMQETGVPFNKNLFTDTCHKYQSLNCWDLNYHSMFFPRVVEFSKDGGLFVCGEDGNHIVVWQIGELFSGKKEPKPIKMLGGFSSGILISLTLSQENHRIFSSTSNGFIIIRDFESKNMLHNIEHSSMVFEVALPSDNKQGDIFASASSGGVLRIFDLRRSSSVPVIETLQPAQVMGGQRSSLYSVMFSPKDLTQLATAGYGGAQVIDIRADPNKGCGG